jgi:hypothetical protein
MAVVDRERFEERSPETKFPNLGRNLQMAANIYV